MIKYNNQHVDERYSAIFEPNLFTQAWLIPNLTCSTRYQEGPAGGIFVHKLKGAAAVTPGKPGRDFTHEETQDELIQILLNNNFQKSRKIYGVQANAVSAPLANENLSTVVQEIREGREYAALACLITEGTASTTTTAITPDNIKEMIIKERTELSKAKGKANVILCSPDTYAAILTAAGKEFVASRNERIQMAGQVGEWYGFTIVEVNGLASANAVSYYYYTGNQKTVNTATLGGVDFIMYYSEAFSVVDNLNALRVVESPEFIGSLAQCETNTGYRVTNPALVRVRKHTTT
jgi:hypothetical protein